MQSNQLHALGKSNTLQEIIRSTKLNTLYTGWTATLYREVPGYGIYFTTYEYLKSKTRDNIPTQPQAFGIGCCSGFASWIFIYPADPIKTIMQNSKELFGDKYNMYSAIRHIYSTHGFGGFYRGFSLGLFRSMPLHGGAICGYELTLKINKKFANY